MGIHELTLFFGWSALINITILAISTLFISLFKEPIINIHSKLLGINASELPVLYFKYLANYKIIILVFNVVPYIALKLIV